MTAIPLQWESLHQESMCKTNGHQVSCPKREIFWISKWKFEFFNTVKRWSLHPNEAQVSRLTLRPGSSCWSLWWGRVRCLSCCCCRCRGNVQVELDVWGCSPHRPSYALFGWKRGIHCSHNITWLTHWYLRYRMCKFQTKLGDLYHKYSSKTHPGVNARGSR